MLATTKPDPVLKISTKRFETIIISCATTGAIRGLALTDALDWQAAVVVLA
jgi:hypothetical protein